MLIFMYYCKDILDIKRDRQTNTVFLSTSPNRTVSLIYIIFVTFKAYEFFKNISLVSQISRKQGKQHPHFLAKETKELTSINWPMISHKPCKTAQNKHSSSVFQVVIILSFQHW